MSNDHAEGQLHTGIVTEDSAAGITFLQLHLGGDRNFCYLIGDPVSGQAAAVDPGFAPEQMHAIAGDQGLRIATILITHGHGDHVGGVARLVELSGATVRAGGAGSATGARAVADGEEIAVGALGIQAMATPGHAPDHVCYLCQDRLITGDLLFCGKVGGTGAFFEGSSAEAEWESLQKVLALPAETRIYPGHDYYGGQGQQRQSTIGHERDHNPFLAGDFAAFVDLKENWLAYKQEHGIR